jgi:hypothetical protein
MAPAAVDGTGQIFRLGGQIDLNQEVSWCPPGVTRRQHIAPYVIRGSDGGVLLVDTGVRLHQDLVLSQLENLVPEDTTISVLLTRTEMECCLNLPAIEERFRVSEVWYTGGITVPRTRAVARRVSVDPGTSLELEPVPGINIELHSPLLRLLPTLWVFHPDSGVLLTSDAFTYGHDGGSDPHDGLVKFRWIASTDSRPIADDVRRIVRDRGVTAIGPGYGEPFVGREACFAVAAEFADAIAGMGLEKDE